MSGYKQGAIELANAWTVTILSAVRLAVAALLLSLSTTASADSSAFFGSVGRYRIMNNESYTCCSPSQPIGKDYCFSLCTFDALCAGVNYEERSRECKLLLLKTWQLDSDDGYLLFVRGYYQGASQPLGNCSGAACFISRLMRSAGGRFRTLPGAYPALQSFASQTTGGVIDSLHCRQLCENRMTNCSLFAYNAGQSRCYIFTVDVQPRYLSFNTSDRNWTSYYRFRSDVQECSTSYYLVKQSMSFDSAEQYCLNTHGARLAAVNSADEQTFLAGVIDASTDLKNHNFWIGGRSAISYPYDFRWTCGGTNVSYSNWRDEEPSDGDERCIHLCYEYTWNNINCNADMFFICEDCLLNDC